MFLKILKSDPICNHAYERLTLLLKDQNSMEKVVKLYEKLKVHQIYSKFFVHSGIQDTFIHEYWSFYTWIAHLFLEEGDGVRVIECVNIAQQ